MNKISKFLKLFCFSMIAIFVIGFSGKVSAYEAPGKIKVETGVNWYSGYGISPIFGIHDTQGNWQYAFCLNSGVPIYYGEMPLDNSLYSAKRSNVNKVINKALQLGLGTGSNQWGISDTNFYGIVQSAVWYTIHGNGTYGYTSGYQNWVKNKGFTNIFNTIVNAVNEEVLVSPYINFVGNDGMVVDGNYLVSNEYRIDTNIPSNVNIRLSVANGEVCYNGSCSGNTINVKNGDVVKVRVSKPTTGSGSLSVTLTATSDSYNSGYDTYFYRATGNKQNIGTIIPRTVNASKSITVNGKYQNAVSIQIQKLNVEGKKIAGAVIGLYDSNNNLIKKVTSTGPNASNEAIELNPGSYYIKEISAPAGYFINKDIVKFYIDNNGNVTDVSGNVVSSKTFSITDKETYLDVSKTDATGQKELPGAKLQLLDSNGKLIDSWTSSNEEHRVSGLIIGNIYEIIEDYAPAGYAPLKNSIKFVLNADGSVTTCNIVKDSNGKDKCEAMSTEDILNIKNEVTKLDVSKTDATGQKELPGAKLQLLDSNGKLIDSWTSTTEEHRVSGLVIGDIYEIIEDYAPEGFIPLQNSIKFVLNADGSVTTCNIVKDSNGKDKCEAMSTEDILKIKNEVTKIKISKIDITNQKEQPGATLKILTEDGKPVYQDGKILEWVSTDEPHYIEMLPVGKYKLVETVVPEGYAAVTSEVIFEVKATGEIQTVVFKNDVTKLLISKKDVTTGEEIPGAHLQILDSNGNVVAEWVSGTEPYYIEKLPIGKYSLVETIYPDNYEESMIVNGSYTSKYDFEITDGELVKIDVYNQVIDVPNTGMNVSSTYIIGGFAMIIGIGTVTIARKKED